MRQTASDSSTWPEEHKFCGGLNQSPVDICTDDVVPNPTLNNLVYINFDTKTKEELTLLNTGEQGTFPIQDWPETLLASLDRVSFIRVCKQGTNLFQPPFYVHEGKVLPCGEVKSQNEQVILCRKMVIGSVQLNHEKRYNSKQ